MTAHYKDKQLSGLARATALGPAPRSSRALELLRKADWDFRDDNTGYLSHNFHPYPAKFIPQIPRTLIHALSGPRETILDPFCGSGTSLVEAVLSGRNAVGVDINPLAVLISKAKTAVLAAEDVTEIERSVARAARLVERYCLKRKAVPDRVLRLAPDYHNSSYWFDDHVRNELALIKSTMRDASEPAQTILAVAFSSIIVGVSRQDGETRYARVDRRIVPGKALRRFSEKLRKVVPELIALNRLNRGFAEIFEDDAQELSKVDTASIDCAIFSPPYLNAFDYHLYHRHRMFWLDMDPVRAKALEIGAHLKYEPDSTNFCREMGRTFDQLYRVLRRRRYACCIIGDSVMKGQVIDTAKLMGQVAARAGFQKVAHLKRKVRVDRKYFSGAMERLREESILIFERP